MPLEVKDIEWSETISHVTIQVPLKGVKPHGVDIVTSNEYLKVSFPPYIYEAFLYAPIDEDASKATIGSGLVVFNCVKQQQEIWEQLQSPQSQEKEFKKNRREAAWTYNKEKAEQKRKEKVEVEDKQKKLVVREQIRLDQEERQRLKEAIEAETRKALEEIEQSEDSQKQKNADKGSSASCKLATNINGHLPDSKLNHIFTEADGSDKEEPLPAPRSTGTIRVSFTPRVFPTPSRESKAPEEEAWLEKVTAMNKMKKNEDAVDMEEMNPIWLKEKGDAFCKQGNFVAAINAYTAAIVLDGTVPSLYSNRSACHLHMKQYKECIQDCTMTLELLTPPVPGNAQSRCRALVRRGTAYFNLEEYVEALKDYEAGLKICPNIDSVRQDAEKIRKIIEGTS